MPVDSRAIGWEDWKNTPKLKIRKIKIIGYLMNIQF